MARLNDSAEALGSALLDHVDDLLILLGVGLVTAGFWLIHAAAALLFLGGVFVLIGAAIGGRLATAPDDPEEEGET